MTGGPQVVDEVGDDNPYDHMQHMGSGVANKLAGDS